VDRSRSALRHVFVTIGGGRKLRYIGTRRNRAWFVMTGAAYNIIRIAALDAAVT